MLRPYPHFFLSTRLTLVLFHVVISVNSHRIRSHFDPISAPASLLRCDFGDLFVYLFGFGSGWPQRVKEPQIRRSPVRVAADLGIVAVVLPRVGRHDRLDAHRVLHRVKTERDPFHDVTLQSAIAWVRGAASPDLRDALVPLVVADLLQTLAPRLSLAKRTTRQSNARDHRVVGESDGPSRRLRADARRPGRRDEDLGPGSVMVDRHFDHRTAHLLALVGPAPASVTSPRNLRH